MVERLVENERVQREAITERLVECDSEGEAQNLFLCVSQSIVLRVVATIRVGADDECRRSIQRERGGVGVAQRDPAGGFDLGDGVPVRRRDAQPEPLEGTQVTPGSLELVVARRGLVRGAGLQPCQLVHEFRRGHV